MGLVVNSAHQWRLKKLDAFIELTIDSSRAFWNTRLGLSEPKQKRFDFAVSFLQRSTFRKKNT